MSDKAGGSFDVAVVGGGFFGCRTAIVLAKRGLKVVLLERERSLMGRASAINQARIHNGYHYPRSLMTAMGSHQHYQQFMEDYRDCVMDDFEHVYAIASRFSKVNSSQFKAFCKTVGLPRKAVSVQVAGMFERSMIEEAFVVSEAGLDTAILAKMVANEIAGLKNITLKLGVGCDGLQVDAKGVRVKATKETFAAKAVIVAAYAGVNRLLRSSGLVELGLKAEITEMCLVKVPAAFKGLGVTVMDGPFFSCMPYGKGGFHTLSHVRYTPHALLEDSGEDPYEMLKAYRKENGSRYPFMRNDAARYIPLLREAKFEDSMFEVKTVPHKHEMDDGRPILMREHEGRLGDMKNAAVVSLLGSKLDSIYEWEALLAERFA